MITQTNPSRVAPRREQPLILVVDDDVTVRTLAEYHLGAVGFDVVTLDCGSGVVAKCQELLPDAVLLDVMLPDAVGFDLCRELRAAPDIVYMPIVMLTSLDDEGAIRQAFEAGASEFVPKPINWVHEGYRLRYLLRAAGNLRDLDRARQDVARAGEEWEKTFDAIEDPVVLLNPDLTILRANRAASRWCGLSRDQLPGRRYAEAIACGHDEDCLVSKALATDHPVQAEVRGYGRAKRDCLVSVAPIPGADGRPTSLVYTIKDVTEYRELQKELLHAQKMEALGVLAAGVTHDFNNLLQGIVGLADILSIKMPAPAEMREDLEKISDVAARGRALTQQLLFTSRKAEGEKRIAAVGPLLDEVALLLSRTRPQNIRIEIEAPGDLWKVKADISHLHQALMNLAVNAVQAMPVGGNLRLQAANVTLDNAYSLAHPDSHAGPHVMLAVSDTGTGIPRELLAKIYDPFFTTKPVGEGTGLGLSIVFGIVRDHGGHLCCYSKQGEGATFRIYLPASLESAESAAVAARRPAAAGFGAGKTILVAEDEPLILDLLVRILEDKKYRVVQTVNGQEALDHYLANPGSIDAVILDCNMPVMSGDVCLQALKRHGCQAPVLLTTGALFSAQRQAELLDSAAGIVTKPFHLGDLIAALEHALVSRQRNRE